MGKLGALKKEEEDRLRRQAMKNNALDKLAELLPPLMERTGRAQGAAQRGADAAKEAASLLPWVEAERKKLEAKLAVRLPPCARLRPPACRIWKGPRTFSHLLCPSTPLRYRQLTSHPRPHAWSRRSRRTRRSPTRWRRSRPSARPRSSPTSRSCSAARRPPTRRRPRGRRSAPGAPPPTPRQSRRSPRSSPRCRRRRPSSRPCAASLALQQRALRPPSTGQIMLLAPPSSATHIPTLSLPPIPPLCRAQELVARQARMQGPTLELERLQRGCRQVGAWVGSVEPVAGCADVGDSEGAVLVLLEDAERVRAELVQQVCSVAPLRLQQTRPPFPSLSTADCPLPAPSPVLPCPPCSPVLRRPSLACPAAGGGGEAPRGLGRAPQEGRRARVRRHRGDVAAGAAARAARRHGAARRQAQRGAAAPAPPRAGAAGIQRKAHRLPRVRRATRPPRPLAPAPSHPRTQRAPPRYLDHIYAAAHPSRPPSPSPPAGNQQVRGPGDRGLRLPAAAVRHARVDRRHQGGGRQARRDAAACARGRHRRGARLKPYPRRAAWQAAPPLGG